jgi:hypothetical protein
MRVSGYLRAVAVCASAATVVSQTIDRDTPVAEVFIYGGSGRDVVNAVTVDPQGNIYIVGNTSSPNLPATTQAFQKQPKGTDAFVAKLDASGRVMWSTYLGGNDARYAGRFGAVIDDAKAVAVDPSGNVYVAGSTGSTDFPTVNAFQSSAQSTRAGSSDGFLAKLNPDGSRLLFSTYLGGLDERSSADALVVGPAGEAWVGISTAARQFPATRDISAGGAGWVVVAKFLGTGNPVWLTRLGYGDERLGGLAVDDLGQAHVTAFSPRSPCALGSGSQVCHGWYLMKLDGSGSRALFAAAISQSPSQGCGRYSGWGCGRSRRDNRESSGRQRLAGGAGWQ